jgi:alcohol dehydrogenase
MTEGYGVDSSLDCLPPGATADAFMRPLFTLRRGGLAATVGGVRENVAFNAFWLMTNRLGLLGSVWFTTGEGQDMAAMVAAGTLDVSPLEHCIFPLSQVNDAMSSLNDRNGGFTNFVVDPTQAP